MLTLFKTLFYIVCFYIVILILFSALQRYVTYFPLHDLPQPAEAGVPEMQIVQLHTADNLTLQAWYAPAASGFATLLYLHGNGGNIAGRGAIVRPYLNQGMGVLLVEYRGYGGNPGIPSEAGLYQDALAAWQFLQHQRVPDRCLIIYGESLGTAPATYLAGLHPPAALVLAAPFSSLAAVGAYHYFFLPVRWLVRDGFYMQDRVKQVHVPLLVLLAAEDSIVPPKLTQQLFVSANFPKKLVVYPETDHNELFMKVAPTVLEFITAEKVCS
jgi:uncharacterized protein